MSIALDLLQKNLNDYLQEQSENPPVNVFEKLTQLADELDQRYGSDQNNRLKQTAVCQVSSSTAV